MTFLPLVAAPLWREPRRMEIVLLLLLVLVNVGAILGWTADSRDSADWKPTNAGQRNP